MSVVSDNLIKTLTTNLNRLTVETGLPRFNFFATSFCALKTFKKKKILNVKDFFASMLLKLNVYFF